MFVANVTPVVLIASVAKYQGVAFSEVDAARLVAESDRRGRDAVGLPCIPKRGQGVLEAALRAFRPAGRISSCNHFLCNEARSRHGRFLRHEAHRAGNGRFHLPEAFRLCAQV